MYQSNGPSLLLFDRFQKLKALILKTQPEPEEESDESDAAELEEQAEKEVLEEARRSRRRANTAKNLEMNEEMEESSTDETYVADKDDDEMMDNEASNK